MISKNYYNYYEILFSLRKGYLKNQEIINKLLSYIKISCKLPDEYEPNLVFKPSNRYNYDSLLLIVKKRQSCIRLLLDSLYSSIVYSDPNLKQGVYSFSFRISKDYVYLLDYTQDGRHLNVKVEIINPIEFIELYKYLIENSVCKHGKTNLLFEKEFIQLSNNGINLLHLEDDYTKSVKLDYNGLEDFVITNNAQYLKDVMKLQIYRNDMPEYFRNIIDSNMDEYSYSIKRDSKKKAEFYTVDDYGKKLILKTSKQPPNFIF